MIRPFVAQISQFRATWLAIGLLVGILLLATAAVVVVPRLGTPGGTQDVVTQQHPGYGTGYPQHGGLAGTGTVRAADPRTGYGTGYPQHGGLAGTGTVRAADPRTGYGTGYPQHGGLAGPSVVDTER